MCSVAGFRLRCGLDMSPRADEMERFQIRTLSLRKASRERAPESMHVNRAQLMAL
jgi:hypothetical protein